MKPSEISGGFFVEGPTTYFVIAHMTPEELQTLLEELIVGWENEVVEFKEASDNFPTSDIGKYFSALANEANLRNKESGWLVFGVHNKTRSVVGTSYREDRERLLSIKNQIADGTDPSTSFREVHVLITSAGQRVILFEVPPAPRGIPIGWNGHYHARNHESLVGLSIAKLEEIRAQSTGFDWSAAVVPDASRSDLDDAALQLAREKFADRVSRIDRDTIMGWPLQHFLDQAMVTINGRITRTALLLLGKPTAAHYLSPAPAELTWKLEGPERAYEHFGPPFLLTTSLLYQRIRNLTLKFLPPDQLIPKEVPKYDQAIVLEALHNCIAHQDYTRNERVLVTERIDELEFRSAGNFYDGSPEDYVLLSRTPGKYRNAFLARAMSHLGMVDRMGFGIRDVMFQGQAKSYRPLPFYEPDSTEQVVLHLPGRIIDENYSRLLLANPDLKLSDILALDRIQKKLPIPNDVVSTLRKRGWVEGRRPNIHISAAIAATTGQKVDYIRTRRQDDEHYKKLVTDYLEEWGEARPKEIRDLLLSKLSDGLTEQQKRNKVRNLLTAMRKEGNIVAEGIKNAARWKLNPTFTEERSEQHDQ